MNWNGILKAKNTLITNAAEIKSNPDEFGETGWYRVLLKTTVRQGESLESTILSYLRPGRTVHVIGVEGRRAQIDLPIKGWVSMISSKNARILEAVENCSPGLPMPSELFSGGLEDVEAEYDDSGEIIGEDLAERVQERDLVLDFLRNAKPADQVFQHFQLVSQADQEKFELFYCATISAFVYNCFGDLASILQPKHLSVKLRLIFQDGTYSWSDIQGRLSKIQNEFELFKNAENLIPWEVAPIARTAQEFKTKLEGMQTRIPDGIHLEQCHDDHDGSFCHDGYMNMKPLYVRDDGLRCILFEDGAWWLNSEPSEEAEKFARLEVDSPHPACKTQSKWLLYDEITQCWRKCSRIRIRPIIVSEVAL